MSGYRRSLSGRVRGMAPTVVGNALLASLAVHVWPDCRCDLEHVSLSQVGLSFNLKPSQP